MPVERKNKRLPSMAYRGKGVYFVTICTQGRRSVFCKPRVAEFILRCLKSAASEHNYSIHAYCLMPDHLHFLGEAAQSVCDLPRFVSRFKQETGFAYQKKTQQRLWQHRYYDHVLRRPEDADSIAWYIWMNPVRKGLVADPQQYAFSGSFTEEWPKNSASNASWSPPWKPKQNQS